jgi:hypothetical protein
MPNRDLKRQQVQELYRRLQTSKPANTDEEALLLIAQLMKEIGDEMTNEPYDPTRWKDHDRIYPPQGDREQTPSGVEGARVFWTLAHEVIVGFNGAIVMRKRKTFEVEFTKAGHDGQEIAL